MRRSILLWDHLEVFCREKKKKKKKRKKGTAVIYPVNIKTELYFVTSLNI